MTNPTPPKNLILATDLGARSDRALDRAFYLSAQWGARLTIAHAVEFEPYRRHVPSWRQETDRALVLKDRILEGLKLEGRPLPDLVIEDERPEELVLNLAERIKADLIITGIAHAEPLGRCMLGNTVNAVMRKAACPVLTVKKRVPQGYRHIAVGIDMSDFSKKALHYALACFPDIQKLSLVHAVSVPFRGLSEDPADYARNCCEDARARCEAYLPGILPASVTAELIVDEGNPGSVLASYADDSDVDLIVAGTHGQNGLLQTLLGTAAIDILEASPCDVLIVR